MYATGVILLIVGAVGALLSLVFWFSWGGFRGRVAEPGLRAMNRIRAVVGASRSAAADRRRAWPFAQKAEIVALVAAVAVFAAGAARPSAAEAAPATAQAAAAAWPVPVPGWFWTWARWYLGRGEFADAPLRSEAMRPAAAPARIPGWAWRRLAVLVGDEPPVAEEPERRAELGPTWPVPLPQWFWVWARWYLGRGEFADEPLQSRATRPSSAPSLVPEWAWRRLIVLEGGSPPPLPDRVLRSGAGGRAVEGLQRALNAAGYPAGPIDGSFGAKTRDAVLAFEKVHGFERDGIVSQTEYVRIIRLLRPAPPLDGAGDYVYVDLGRQVLFEVRNGHVVATIAVSTGGGYPYTGLDGQRHLATTPTGDYRVFRKVDGWDESYLGRLYYPSYYSGGYAIHGAKNVPPRPVSHGCVRIPLWLSVDFYNRTPIGTRVFIR